MIKKERKIPIKLEKLEALNRRIPSQHPKKSQILEELTKRRAGYYGEKSLDYHLSFMDEKNYHILHDLRLRNIRKQYFQIDTLISSPYFISILDVKNMGGTIIFDRHFHQLIQQNGEVEKAYQDPVTQVKRHELQLKEWLHQHKFPAIPILPLVVISNPSTIIKTIGDPKEYQHITKAIHINFEISKYEKLYKEVKLSNREWNKLASLLVKKHTPEEYDVMVKFHIHKSEILTGVHCPNCSAIPMKRLHGKWLCLLCQFSSKTAYALALRDYALLFGTSISNQEIREFLQLTPKNIVTNITKSMNLPSSGVGRAKIYYLDQLLR
ncbi:nuclease-related domain-containing protein [Bacillus sp. FJAT-49736]|uniref:nuclease-related domain-containing protein n=1 Tax=Bacillus sp. FJAT-49736 TaxID=2833582 RepID=UPI001BC96E95|nr:nuclease-related domain-containing protein [Bacillus sp. FJAT-49736]MBS4174382.1 NERD domain-containing protein [Bacillus sp. FJAT-49736]